MYWYILKDPPYPLVMLDPALSTYAFPLTPIAFVIVVPVPLSASAYASIPNKFVVWPAERLLKARVYIPFTTSASPDIALSTCIPYILCSLEVSPPVVLLPKLILRPPCSLSPLVAPDPDASTSIYCPKAKSASGSVIL